MIHTKEPWDTDGFSSVGATGSDQFNGGYFTAICEGPDKVDNARRIAACVNACAGIPTDKLSEARQVCDELADINTLEQENKLMRARMERLEGNCLQLLAVLHECDEAMVYMSEYDIPLCLPDRVKAAIAKAQP